MAGKRINDPGLIFPKSQYILYSGYLNPPTLSDTMTQATQQSPSAHIHPKKHATISVADHAFAVEVFREHPQEMHVAYCPDLDISSCGDSAQEAYDNMVQVLATHLEIAIERNNLRQLLEKHGMGQSVYRKITSFYNDSRAAGRASPKLPKYSDVMTV